MATATLGTNATTTLTALAFTKAAADADIATMAIAIKNDLLLKQSGVTVTYPGAFSKMGLLYIPNRGVLQVLPGDFVGVDASGWPVLVSAEAIAFGSTSWTHT